MQQRFLPRYRIERVHRAIPERPARSRKDDSPHRSVVLALQTLKYRRVFAVDRQNPPLARLQGIRHDGPPSDERLLVREGNRSSSLQRRKYRLEAGKTDNRRDHDIRFCTRGKRGRGIRSPHDLDPRARQRIADLCIRVIIRNCYGARPISPRLFDEQTVASPMRGETFDPESIRKRIDDLKGLGAD